MLYYAIIGFRFEKARREKYSIKNACDMARACSYKQQIPKNPPWTDTQSNEELLHAEGLVKARNLLMKGYPELFMENAPWGMKPNLVEVSKSANALIKAGKKNTYCYYFFLGLVVASNLVETRYCKCCGWRFVADRHSAYCEACSTAKINNRYPEQSIRTQRKILAAVRNSSEYTNFLKLRKTGEYNMIRVAVGEGLWSSNPLPSDPKDFTVNAGYKIAKANLAKLWDSVIVESRKDKKMTTIEMIETLARQGLSKAEVARELSFSRAYVSKISGSYPHIETLFAKRKN